jgi:2-polyprenyl-3-methyl-5-hydroxy-6-metoxy-1,4-benzoquinol methylase
MPSLSNGLKTSTKKTCSSIINCSEPKYVVFEKKGFQITECKQCGHRFLPIEDFKNHLSDNYSDDYFFGGGDGYPNYLDQKDILAGYGKRYAGIVAKYRRPGKMLDVGSAAGFILKGFQQSGWECNGVEPNDRVAEYGRKELGLNIVTGGLETFQTTEKFDLVTMIQVIGHFYDIDTAMKNITELTKKDGLILIESWNRNSIIAKILGKGWHEYSPPSVVHWFSDKTLIQLLNSYGFGLIAKGYPAKKINIHHALSFYQTKLSDSSIQKKLLRIIDKMMGKINVIYPPVDVKWYLFQKSSQSS